MIRSLLIATLLFQIGETIEVHVAEVEVVVVDARGKPVAGLTKDDFELRSDGRVRPITNFYAIDGGHGEQVTGDRSTTTPTPSPVTSSLSPVTSPPVHLVLFVDQERLDLRQRNRVLASLAKFADTHLRPGVDASLIVYNRGAKVRLQPTTDVARIRAAIEELGHESPHLTEANAERRHILQIIDDAADAGGRRSALAIDQIKQQMFVYGENQITRLRQALDSIDIVMNRLRGAPGRKVFVHVSSGLPLQPAVEVYDYFERRLNNPIPLDKIGLQQMSAYEHLVASAQAAGVALYTIDASGLTLDEGANLQNAHVDRLDSGLMRDNLRGPLQLLADETGGKAIINENDFDRALGEIEAQYTTYYSLGFRADADKKMHNVEVRVKRPGLTVRSAHAYRDRDADERARDGVIAALDFPFAQNPLGVAIDVGRIAGNSVPISVTVAPGKLVALSDGTARKAYVRCYFAMRDANGGSSPLRIVDEELVVADDTAPVVLRKVSGLTMRPGKYTLSMAVRDLTSNDTSFVTRAIEVPKPR